MIITLEVHSEIPDIGRFGTLSVAGEKFPTVEQAWRNNQREVSCVPLGTYKLVPFTSEKYGDTWAMENEDLQVAVHEKDGMRFACLFVHKGNWPSNFKGCIGAGERLKYFGGELGVTNTVITTEHILGVLKQEDEHTLIIRRK